jgi:hypothetical protein
MRWGMLEKMVDEGLGDLVHDDLLISAAIRYVLDGQVRGLAQNESCRMQIRC